MLRPTLYIALITERRNMKIGTCSRATRVADVL